MVRDTVWLLAAAMASGGGCLTAGNDGFSSGGDADVDTDADSDADTDSGTGSDTGSEVVCPPYPEGAMGFEVGQIVQNFTLPGDGPEDLWSMEDFWCMAHQEENPATVLLINIHSLT